MDACVKVMLLPTKLFCQPCCCALPFVHPQGILQGLKSLGFAAPSYAPTKLLAGWGREVCVLLDGLTDVTLERRGLNRLPKTVFVQDG